MRWGLVSPGHQQQTITSNRINSYGKNVDKGVNTLLSELTMGTLFLSRPSNNTNEFFNFHQTDTHLSCPYYRRRRDADDLWPVWVPIYQRCLPLRNLFASSMNCSTFSLVQPRYPTNSPPFNIYKGLSNSLCPPPRWQRWHFYSFAK